MKRLIKPYFLGLIVILTIFFVGWELVHRDSPPCFESVNELKTISAGTQISPLASNREILTDTNAHQIKQITDLTEDSNEVISIAFSPNGKLLAAANKDITLWDLATDDVIDLFKGDEYRILELVFSPDGGKLAAVGEDGTVRIWDTAQGNQVAVLQNANQGIKSIAFTPDGQYLVTGGGKNATLQVWDITLESVQRTLRTGGIVDSLAISPDGLCLVIAEMPEGTTGGNVIRLVDFATGEDRTFPHTYAGEIVDVGFSADGKLVFSSGADGVIRFWDISMMSEILLLPNHYDGSFSPSNSLFVSGISGTGLSHYNLSVFSIEQNTELAELEGGSQPITDIAFSPSGDLLAAASRDGFIRLWGVSK